MKWEKVRLGEVCERVKTVSPANHYGNKNFIYLDIASIDYREKSVSLANVVSGNSAPSRARQVLEDGDVLVSTVRPNLNAVAIVPKNAKNVVGSTGFCVLRPSNQLIGRYLFYWLRTKDFIESMVKLATGASYPAVSDAIIKNSKIPLPPLPAQQKIAALLDAADAVRQKDKTLLAKYDALLQSTFHHLFGDPVKNEKGWEIGTIRDLVRAVNYGTSKPAEEGGAYPYLRMNNITYSGEWDFESMKYINLSPEEEEKYMLRKGDVVFNRTNSKELVGKTAVYEEDVPMAIAGYLIRVRTNEKAHPIYISRFLNSNHGKAKLRAMCKSIVGMANINAQELQNIQIPLPPLSLQNQFAQIVENIQAQKALVKAAAAKSEALFQSLLHRAFAYS